MTLAVILCLVLTTEIGFGKGSYSSVGNRKWKEFQQWRKGQDERMKRLEQEAERSFQEMRKQDGHFQNTPHLDTLRRSR